MTHEDQNRRSLPTWFFALGTLALSIGFLWFASDFLIPLTIAGLLFILLSALVDKIQSTKILGWSPPAFLAQILGTALIIGTVLVLGSIVSSSADEIQNALPMYRERLQDLLEKLESLMGARVLDAGRNAVQNVDLGAWIAAIAGQFGGALSMLILVTLYLVFLGSERAAWVEKMPRLFTTDEGAHRARKVLQRISLGVKQYMWVNAVTSAMSGVVAFAIFTWVDLDFASLLALIVFLAGFIPNIGAFIGIALPSLVALIQFDSLTPFLIVLFGYGAADQFISNVVQPSMQGRSLNLSTFMVMVSLTFWATLWGGIGAFLAIPMMVVTMVICAEIPAIRWIAVLLSRDGRLPGEQTSDDHE